ncbi:Gfo/Idh/MocA family protein [Trichocoleus sp. FACHB-591]|uniref:Gfo/Idh/MocA family protein n=1 Tax=Trichocoleus sp. FACHB-591 TaxID=2692872 RepID=UPI00351C9329
MTTHFFKDMVPFPLNVGLVGTGYAAKLRAEAFQADSRSQLVAVVGHELGRAVAFSQTYQAEALDNWSALLNRPEIDLVVICTVNRDHGAIARAALEAGKHVVVEYPLALDVAEAEMLIALAKTQNKLLHVEHIELLGGLHQALRKSLPQIGSVFHARYATINPQNPAPQKWTYQPELFGFPFSGATSRIHRLTDLFGTVTTVSCQARYWRQPEADQDSGFYQACLCTAHLNFAHGVLAEVTYGKGETLWQSARTFEVQGTQGALVFDGDRGTLIQAAGEQVVEVGGRRGLFAKDTANVLDHLYKGTPLYVSPEASLYALRVADAARRSAETGQVVAVGS